MDRTIVSTKGQVVLPKEIREKRHWTAGTTLVVEDRPDGVLLRADDRKKSGSILDLAGVLKYDGPPRTLEEMDAAIIHEVKRRHARGRY
jgi:AbrB family looped-hinge helix DNA binding protein